MPERSSRTADVLVIGGGIIGCSIAWRLALGGMKVIVLDRSEPGAEASSAAAGMLAPVAEMVEPLTFSEFCFASRNLYPGFAAEVEEASGREVAYRSDGTLLVALNDSQDQNLAKIQSAPAAQRLDLQALTATDVHAWAGGLSRGIRRGLFVPGDHWVDNERLMQALLVACRRAGVCLESATAVHKFHRKNGRIQKVEAGTNRTFSAETYVLAAGCWSGELAQELGVYLPISPCRGQMLEFESVCEVPFVLRAGIHYLVPRRDRRVLVGTTSEYVGFEKAVTAEGLFTIIAGATHLAPFVNEFRFLRAWAGLRPATLDHLPVLGYGEIENLVFATGHFRHGILLAPVTAEVITDLILKRSNSRPLDLYRPTRFKPEGGRQQAEGSKQRAAVLPAEGRIE